MKRAYRVKSVRFSLEAVLSVLTRKTMPEGVTAEEKDAFLRLIRINSKTDAVRTILYQHPELAWVNPFDYKMDPNDPHWLARQKKKYGTHITLRQVTLPDGW